MTVQTTKDVIRACEATTRVRKLCLPHPEGEHLVRDILYSFLQIEAARLRHSFTTRAVLREIAREIQE